MKKIILLALSILCLAGCDDANVASRNLTKAADNWQSFEGASVIEVNTSTSYSGKHRDNLVFKF